MKRLLSLAILATGWTQVQAQDVKIEFITPSIVHVVKGQPTKTLVVTAKPEQVSVVKKGNTTSSKDLTVKQDAQGNLTITVTPFEGGGTTGGGGTNTNGNEGGGGDTVEGGGM